MKRFKRIIAVIAIMIIASGLKTNNEIPLFEHDKEIREIEASLNQAEIYLNEASLIVNDDKRLKRLKRKLKN